MKHAVSIFLLALMSAVALRPAVALHFCGGKLYSVHYGKHHVQMSCCKQATSCTDAYDGSLPKHGKTSFFDAKNTCCSNYSISLSTDTFRHYQALATSVVPAASPMLCLFPDFMYFADNNACDILRRFPPNNLIPSQSERLTRFCVFRI